MSTTEGPYQQTHTDTVFSDPPVVTAEPVVAAPVHAVPVQPAVVAPVAAAEVQTTYARRFTPDAVIAGLVGLALLIIGLIVIVRAGLDAPLSDPVVQVLGFTHTASLGLAEVAMGLFLLIAASARSRGAEVFGGLVMVVGGVVGVAQTESFRDTLALESSWAWIILIAGAFVAVMALVLPRIAHSATTVHQQAV